jgi:hypothetical protein
MYGVSVVSGGWNARAKFRLSVLVLGALLPAFCTTARALTVSLIHGDLESTNVRISFVAEGRIGDTVDGPGGRTYEVAVSESASGCHSSVETANYIWRSGATVPFVLRYEPAVSSVTFSVDGIVVTHRTMVSPADLRDIFIRVRSAQPTGSLLIGDLLLDGQAVGMSVGASAVLGHPNTLHVAGGTLSDGFTLAGTATMAFPAGRRSEPRNSQLSFEIRVGKDNTAPPGDSDADGMPDVWEQAQGLDPHDSTDAVRDADGDGMSNYGEYKAGTDPKDCESRFRIEIRELSAQPEILPSSSAGGSSAGSPSSAKVAAVEWTSVSNRTYAIWRATSLNQGMAGFAKIASGVPCDVPLNLYKDFTATNAVRYFYRVEIE